MTEAVAVFENESYLPDKYDDEHCGLTKKESEDIRRIKFLRLIAFVVVTYFKIRSVKNQAHL